LKLKWRRGEVNPGACLQPTIKKSKLTKGKQKREKARKKEH